MGAQTFPSLLPIHGREGTSGRESGPHHASPCPYGSQGVARTNLAAESRRDGAVCTDRREGRGRPRLGGPRQGPPCPRLGSGGAGLASAWECLSLSTKRMRAACEYRGRLECLSLTWRKNRIVLAAAGACHGGIRDARWRPCGMDSVYAAPRFFIWANGGRKAVSR